MEVASIAREKDMIINQKIKADKVFVIGPKGEQLGVKSKQDALTLANYSGFDLVLMNPNANPPVCKLMDYNKYKYEKKKKLKESQKKARESRVETKEYRLSPNIDVHDFDTKARKAREYLKKNTRIKVSIRFRGRQIIHTELGKEVLERFAKKLEDVSTIEKAPKLDNRSMIMFLVPKK